MNDLLTNVLVPAAVSLVVIGGGYVANRRLGIATGQQSLVKTLQDNVSALKDENSRIKAEMAACKTRLEDLESVVEDLKAENFDLRTELTKTLLTTRTRRRKPAE